MSKENLRRQPVWIGVLLLGGVYAILRPGYTVTSWGISDVLYSGGSMGLWPLLILIPLFGWLQFRLLRKRGESLAAWLPLVVSGVCLAVAEWSYASGGFSGAILGAAVWFVAFYSFCGVTLGTALAIVLRQKRGVRIAAGVVALALLLVAVWFWPRDLGGKVALDPGGEYVWCFKGNPPESKTVKRDRGELLFSFRYLKVIPAYSGPEELFYGCKLFRLNGEYIILAKDSGSSYVYCYSGPLEDFDGSGLAWRTSSQSAIYGAIY